MAVRWTAHIAMAMQQHGGGAKVPREEPLAQPEGDIALIEPRADRAPPLSEANDAR